MKYKEIKIYPKNDELNELVDRLTAIDRSGLIISDPDELDGFMAARESYQWDYVNPDVLESLKSRPSVTYYIEEGKEDPEFMEIAGEYEYSVSLADDEDWLHKWEEYYVPTRISEHFVVKPLKRDYEKKDGDYVIEIDPGLAFGTGTHATTFLVLRLMEKYMKPGMDVLDVGSGTGILSIAAAMLSAGDILAIDLDPEAVRSSKANAALNGYEDKIRVQYGDLTKGVDYKADMVVANLMADLVCMLSKDIARHMKPGAVYISSGILDEKEKTVSDAIVASGLKIIDVIHADGWCAIAAVSA